MNPSQEPVEPAGYELAHPTGPQSSRWWQMQRSSQRPWRRTALVAVLSAVGVFVLGGPLGLLWAWVAPNVPVIDTGKDIVVNDPSPEEFIAADGWFTLLGLGFGLLVAIVAWLLLRRDRGPFLLVGIVAGTLGAGYWAAPWAGELIGRTAYQHWRETAVQGATYLAPPEVHSTGPMLVPAFAAAIVLTLLAGWSNDPDLDLPGAKPGYGPNNEGPYADFPPGAYGDPATDPAAAASPFGPAAPAGSVAPAAPSGSVGPAGPVAAAAPSGSVGPAGPVAAAAPSGPVAAAGPVAPASDSYGEPVAGHAGSADRESQAGSESSPGEVAGPR